MRVFAYLHRKIPTDGGLTEGFFLVPDGPHVRFEGTENCVLFFGRAIFEHFGRLLTVYVYKYTYNYMYMFIHIMYMYVYICICIYMG